MMTRIRHEHLQPNGSQSRYSNSTKTAIACPMMHWHVWLRMPVDY